jgi:hypothetical protein
MLFSIVRPALDKSGIERGVWPSSVRCMAPERLDIGLLRHTSGW